MCVHFTEGFDRLWFFDRGVSTLQLAHQKLLRVRLVAGGAGRVRKEPLRRAKPTARRETGEGEIEKPLGHHWVMAAI